ncbi:sugar fermentation stimulation protein [Sporanaerobium hydrogeniformans]|uniref:Sugar fermentation stimulation protein n=1 Tax=Sporanaerobium hydrogeniformans TaxID=3072179 RepID=A0AC61DD27_9FIRM|nr:putative glycoside hydrolase [Sporanaerobium hydrogeniformans]PHV71204.1 sugar fermentation stimulation protein [Sporanaerobium hydrogeniformans]
MKKYKVKTQNSYYHYKQHKMWMRRIFVIVAAFGIVGLGAVIVNQKDKNVLAIPEIKAVWLLEQKKEAEPVYLSGNQVKYDLYKAPEIVRGIYIPASKVDKYEDYIALAKKTQVNAFVIDVKNDYGYLTFPTNNPKLQEKGCVLKEPPIENLPRVMSRLYEEGIYPIARIVAFKDSVVTNKYPELAIQAKKGGIYTNSVGDKWLNPYNKENWEYLLEISKEAIHMGFKEIQFDYIRFHESMNEERVQLEPNITKTQIITEFTKYMHEQLKAYDVYISADVFGTIITSKIDAEIVGQDFKELCKYLDYICPMVYPSHYGPGCFGIEYPHLAPYDIILRSMEIAQDEINKNERQDRRAIIRPWLQDFTMSKQQPYQLYGEKQIKAQIQGTYDAGLSEWLFWNAAGQYTLGGLIGDKE